jgi:thiamine-phosphate pyrophosphorylase
VIGVSVRTAGEAAAAEEAGADYLAANLVFATDTKTDISGPLGLDGVRMLRAASELPLVAIGGIDGDNAGRVIAAGADGVAVVSAIMAAPDVGAACRRLMAAATGAADETPSAT